MRNFKKLAAACALAVSAAALAGCEKDAPAPLPQEPNAQTSGWNPIDEANSIVTELSEFTIKSKVTSSDSWAKGIVTTVNTFIVECVANGGNEWECGTIKMTLKDGKWTLSGYDLDTHKLELDSHTETLAQRIDDDIPIKGEAYAEVYINEDGRAVAGIYTVNTGIVPSELPPVEVFDKDGDREWTWDGKMAGVTPSGAVVGTSPKLLLKKSS